MKKIIITFAIHSEFFSVTLSGCEVRPVFTGIGKARAAMNLTKAILAERPDLVLNVGTAGTLNHAVGDVWVCQRFVDRDFLAIHLPGVEFEIDFQQALVGDQTVRQLLAATGKSGVCNTGDSFVTQAESIQGDVVDMEAFAQAIVCKEFDLPFVAVKYVTDVIGQNSVKHWEDKLAYARNDLKKWFDAIV